MSRPIVDSYMEIQFLFFHIKFTYISFMLVHLAGIFLSKTDFEVQKTRPALIHALSAYSVKTTYVPFFKVLLFNVFAFPYFLLPQSGQICTSMPKRCFKISSVFIFIKLEMYFSQPIRFLQRVELFLLFRLLLS